jgi:hypothetical protein
VKLSTTVDIYVIKENLVHLENFWKYHKGQPEAANRGTMAERTWTKRKTMVYKHYSPTKIRAWDQILREGRQFLFHLRRPLWSLVNNPVISHERTKCNTTHHLLLVLYIKNWIFRALFNYELNSANTRKIKKKSQGSGDWNQAPVVTTLI